MVLMDGTVANTPSDTLSRLKVSESINLACPVVDLCSILRRFINENYRTGWPGKNWSSTQAKK